MSENQIEKKKLQSQLADKIMGLFDFVISERKRYYDEHKDKVPSRKDAQSIISWYSNTNSVISGGANLVPGPFGMAAIIPEVVAVIRNQLSMIYDLGMAYGQQKVLGKELLAGIFLSALGRGGVTLLTAQGGKILVKSASIKAIQKIASLIAIKVSEQLVKSLISKWVPIIGAAAMAAWSNYATRAIGKKAIATFEKTIELSPEHLEDIPDQELEQVVQEQPTPPGQPNQPAGATPINYEVLKLQSLINLMKMDGQIKPEEIEYIKPCIEKAEATDQDKKQLTDALTNSTKFTIDYTVFNGSPDDAIGLLVDLVALAKRDGNIHVSEKMYIKQVGKLLGFSDSDIEEMLITNAKA